MPSPAVPAPVAVTDPPASRAELLHRRAERSHLIERALLSKRRLLRAVGWMLLGVVGALTLTRTGGLLDGELRATDLLVAVASAVALVAATAGLAAHRLRTRQLRRALREASECDRTPTARALPAGRVDPELRTIFDARDDADLDVVAQAAVTRAESLAYGTRPMGIALLGMVPAFAGVAALIAAFVVERTADRCAAAVAAAFFLLPTMLMWGTVTSVNWLHQREANRLLRERPAYLMRAAVLRGEQTAVKARFTIPPERIAVAVVFLGMGVVRFGRAPMTGTLAIGGCLVLLAVGVLLSRLLVRRPQVLVSQVRDGAGRPSVLQRPFARVEVTRDGGDLVVTADDGGAQPCRLPVREVLAVEPVRWHPVLPPAVAVLSSREPLLLAGAGMLEHVRALVGAAATAPRATA